MPTPLAVPGAHEKAIIPRISIFVTMHRKTFCIFDLDGTLFDTLGDLARAVNAALAKHNAPAHTEEEIRSFIGNGSMNLIRRSIGDFPVDLQSVFDTYMEIYSRNCTEHTHPMPGVPEFLEARKCRMALLTNKPSVPTHRILDHFGFEKYFETVLCGDTSPARKPAPDGFVQIISKTGIPKEEILMVGDDSPDIQGAKAAGIDSMFIGNGYGKIENCAPVMPNYMISKFSDLLKLPIF